MPLRLIAATLAVAVFSSVAMAQTSPAPQPATPTATPAPASSDDTERASATAVKACQAKWKVEKTKPGAKLGAKAFYTFMANCL